MSNLYIIEAPSKKVSKLGYSQYPLERFVQIQSTHIWNMGDHYGLMPPLFLRYIILGIKYPGAIESVMHYSVLDPHHAFGLEWYRLTPDQILYDLIRVLNTVGYTYSVEKIPDSKALELQQRGYNRELSRVQQEMRQGGNWWNAAHVKAAYKSFQEQKRKESYLQAKIKYCRCL